MTHATEIQDLTDRLRYRTETIKSLTEANQNLTANNAELREWNDVQSGQIDGLRAELSEMADTADQKIEVLNAKIRELRKAMTERKNVGRTDSITDKRNAKQWEWAKKNNDNEGY